MKFKSLLLIVFLFGTLITARVNAQLPKNGIMGHWMFNKNARDTSGKANHAIVTGATLAADRFGNTNSAYSFDGVGNYIQTPVTTANTYTLEAWIKPNSNVDVAILGNDDGAFSGKTWALAPSGKMYIHNCHPSTCNDIYSNGTITLGVWTHVAVSVNAGIATFYINGKASGGGGNVEQYGLTWWIGKGWPARGFFSGLIDDVAIWNRALDSNEVKTVYKDNPATGIGDRYKATMVDIIIYPNPATDKLMLNQKSDVEIFDITGKLVIKATKVSQVEVKDLVKGLYFVRVKDENNNTETKKFIKE